MNIECQNFKDVKPVEKEVAEENDDFEDDMQHYGHSYWPYGD